MEITLTFIFNLTSLTQISHLFIQLFFLLYYTSSSFACEYDCCCYYIIFPFLNSFLLWDECPPAWSHVFHSSHHAILSLSIFSLLQFYFSFFLLHKIPMVETAYLIPLYIIIFASILYLFYSILLCRKKNRFLNDSCVSDSYDV